MPKQGKRSGKLIQKKEPKNPKKFSVIGVDVSNNSAWTLQSFVLLSEAVAHIDKLALSHIDYYVHSDNNRVEYTRKGNVNG